MASPSERLHARGFAADAETERALRAGLAGREAKVQRGRLPAAVRTLAAEPASELVFVDLEGVPDPEAAVKELASVCPLGTTLIAVGPIDTAHLTRGLLRSGVADYLVKPISPADVREAIAAALDDQPERAYAGRVVAFAGAAGSGASTLVAAIAREIPAHGRTVTVFDLDPLSGALSALLDTEPAGDLPALLATLDPGRLLESGRSPDPGGRDDPGRAFDPDESPDPGQPVNPDELSAVCAPAQPGVSLVAYPPAGPLPAAPSPPAVQALVEHLANRAHAVLVTGFPDPEVRLEIMRNADARVLLYEPTLPSISEAVRCLALLGTEHPATVVQCHPRSPRSTLSPAQIRYALAERRPDVVIPFEPALHAASVGGGRARSPGKAWRKALSQVIERAIEGAASGASRRRPGRD